MNGVHTIDTLAPEALLLSLDAILAFADTDARIATLSSLLCFYIEQLGGAIDITCGGYRILIFGPNQPLDVEFHVHRIIERWNTLSHDNYGRKNGGVER